MSEPLAEYLSEQCKHHEHGRCPDGRNEFECCVCPCHEDWRAVTSDWRERWSNCGGMDQDHPTMPADASTSDGES